MVTPDYHFLYLSRNLGAEWFLAAGRAYWQVFRPIVTGDLDLIGYVYRDSEPLIAVTTLARRNLASAVAEAVKARFPAAFHDPLVYDFPEELRLTLEGRATLRQRFGVPDPATPTPTPFVGPTMTPTYGARIALPQPTPTRR
jgi:hypothetical protein